MRFLVLRTFLANHCGIASDTRFRSAAGFRKLTKSGSSTRRKPRPTYGEASLEWGKTKAMGFLSWHFSG
jgi:hypothetical protein